MLFKLILNVQTTGRDSGATTTLYELVKWKNGRSPKTLTVAQLLRASGFTRQLDEAVRVALLESQWATKTVVIDSIGKTGVVIPSDTAIESDTGRELFSTSVSLRIVRHKVVLLDSKSVPQTPKRGKIGSLIGRKPVGGYQPDDGGPGDPPKSV